MKRTKREENALVVVNVIYSILIIVLIYFIVSFIIPSIREIWEIKNSVSTTYSNLNRIKKEGVNHSEFDISSNLIVEKNRSENNNDNLYLSEVLKNVDDEFYNKYIKNSSEGSYDTFIDWLTKKYSNNIDFDDKVAVISKILPVYSDEVRDLWDNSLTDYKFINYIESIAETFNISFSNSIWISNLKIVEDYAVWASDNDLDTNIFYIPLDLDLTWTKSSILEFLYFVDNIWKIELDQNQNIIVKNNLNKDFSDFKNKVLKWQLKDVNYNIFNNQIFDIESVEFDKYFDSSFDLIDSKVSFISNIKNNQWRELIKANVKLRFYIKWIPVYKIQNYIKIFISDFQATSEQVKWYMSKEWSDSPKYQKLVEINSVLDQIQISIITWIQKKLAAKEWLDEAFKQVNIYKSILDDYKKDLEQFKK